MELNENVKTAVKTLNGFDLSFESVLSQNWGDLVPIVCKEMVPGDQFTVDASVFTRLAPLASPTYGKVHGYINYFFVPNRILMTEDTWGKLITGGSDGEYPNSFPYFTQRQIATAMEQFSDAEQREVAKLFTYLGLPDPIKWVAPSSPSANITGHRLSVLPFLAYNRIFGDYYYPIGYDNDADLENIYYHKAGPGFFQLSNEGVIGKFFSLKHACFKKDYLTTAQLRPQRGSEVFASTTSADDGSVVDSNASPDAPFTGNDSTGYYISSTVQRYAAKLQKYLERNSVAGARYFEQMLARFGVKIRAEKLQRSVYLGGKDFWINVSDVTSTAASGSEPLGSQAGKGVGLGQSGVSYSAEEHGFFIGICHLMPESGIVQYLDRMWTRFDRLDYFTPEMEDTGFQPIYNVEVWSELQFELASTSNDTFPYESGVFGYIPRYAEYKFSNPILAGDFKLLRDGVGSVSAQLDSMHLFRLFSANTDSGGQQDIPVLNEEFLTLDVTKSENFNRIFTDTNSDFDHFWTNVQVKIGANRPMLGYAEASTGFINDDKGRLVSMPLFGTRL